MLGFVTATLGTSHMAGAEESKTIGSVASDEEQKTAGWQDYVQFELSYNVDIVMADSSFRASGDWNDNGNTFEIDTKAGSGFFGLGFGARVFPFTEDIGFVIPLRFAFSMAQLSIAWVDQNGDAVGSTDYELSVGGGLGYRLQLAEDLVDDGLGLFIQPDVGLEYLSFSSSPDTEEDEDNEDTFGFNSAAVVFRLGAEFGVAKVLGEPLNIMLACEYHLPFGFSATRTFDGGGEVEGDAKGSASIVRILVGVAGF
jgi:hypothetical protein